LIVIYEALLGKMKAIVSVPYREVVTVAAADEGRFARGFFGSSTLSLTARNAESYVV
jgi:hypothetical protein